MADNTENMMNSSLIAHIRTPTDDEMKRIRELWSFETIESAPSMDIGIELQTYLSHSVRLVGMIAGLHPATGEPALPSQFPLRVTEDGVTRIHDAVRLWSAILSLWTAAK